MHDPLVPEGTGPPSVLDLPTTETLDERIFLSRDLEGRPTDSASVALDKVADSALFFVLDDPSSLRLAGGTWIPSSGVWLSIESSISWLFFAAAGALRFRFSSAAFSNASHASGNQSLHTWQGASWGGTAGIGSGYRSVFCSASNQETSVAVPWKMTYHVTPPPSLVVNKARLTTKTE